MSTKPKYPEVTNEELAAYTDKITALQSIALGTSRLSELDAKDLIGEIFRFAAGGKLRDCGDGNLQYVDGGEPYDFEIPGLPSLAVFAKHTEAALQASNVPLAGCLALAVYRLHLSEQHMVEYGRKILGAQGRQHQLAARRREEQNNVGAWVDGWERHQGITLTPESPASLIAQCAAAAGERPVDQYSEVTIRNYLRSRARQSRSR